jgi:hypothetical protein
MINSGQCKALKKMELPPTLSKKEYNMCRYNRILVTIQVLWENKAIPTKTGFSPEDSDRYYKYAHSY